MALAQRYSALTLKECLQGDGMKEIKEPAFSPLIDCALYDQFVVPAGVDVSTENCCITHSSQDVIAFSRLSS